MSIFKKILVFLGLNKVKVIIFEDEEWLEPKFITEIKKKFEILVLSAHSNLKKVKKFHPNVIVLDYNINFDGIKLLNEIKKLKIKFQVVFRTLYADDENIIDYVVEHCKIPKERILNQDLPGPEFCKFLKGLIY